MAVRIGLLWNFDDLGLYFATFIDSDNFCLAVQIRYNEVLAKETSVGEFMTIIL